MRVSSGKDILTGIQQPNPETIIYISDGPFGPIWRLLLAKVQMPVLIISILLLIAIIYFKIRKKKVNKMIKTCFIISIIIFIFISLILIISSYLI